MQLKTTTEYAVRMMIYLARTQRMTAAAEIAKQAEIPQNYLVTITRYMRNAGLITASSGSKGGYRLRKKASEITLYDILICMEGTLKINRCLEQEEAGRCTAGQCRLQACYQQLQQQIEAYLTGVTLESLLP